MPISHAVRSAINKSTRQGDDNVREGVTRYNGNSRFVRLARVTITPCQTLLAPSLSCSFVHELQVVSVMALYLGWVRIRVSSM